MKAVIVAPSALLVCHGTHAQVPDFNKLKGQLAKAVDSIKPKDPNAPVPAPAGTATPAGKPVAANTPAAPAPKLGTGPAKGMLGGQGAKMTTCEKLTRDPGTQWDVQCVVRRRHAGQLSGQKTT